MSSSVSLDQLLELLEARTLAELYARTNRLVRALGFDHFIYGLRMTLGTGRYHDVVISGYPAAWRTLYEEKQLVHEDPTVMLARQSVIPIIWNEDLFRRHERMSILEESRRFGLNCGITIPLRTEGRDTGLFSVACGKEERLRAVDSTRVAACQLLGTFVHEAGRKLIAKPTLPVDVPKLTAREHECLRWSAQGKSSWEIAQIIRASERTVNFHIANVLRKLDVSNRRQAVAKSLAVGLIQV